MMKLSMTFSSTHLKSAAKSATKRCLIVSAKALYALFLLYLLIFALLWLLPASEQRDPRALTTINDVTQMNPIEVGRVARPTSTAEVAELVAHSVGSISIGGGRYSMGGQIGADQSLHLDMRSMNKVLELNVAERWIKVEAGATWRDVIEAIDPHDLSVQVMQSYANFTVGGAVSVNAHGRYMGQGAVVRSVRELTMVLADGALVTCSRDERPELFFGAIGGYGGLGVITEVVLNLDPHTKIKRKVKTLAPQAYLKHFKEHVEGRDEIIMHNADFFPPAYDTLYLTDWVKTEEAPTVAERSQPEGFDPWLYKTYRFVMGWIPGGRSLRPWLESMRADSEVVEWRNFEASYDVQSLGQISDEDGSYVLHEYFVPPEQLLSFKEVLTTTLKAYEVDVINVSIRHAVADPNTLLSWSPQESFAFVLYYHQKSDQASRERVGEWTQKLQQAVVEHKGTYYLPYQIWASPEVFHKAYPRAKEYFELKRRLDPTSRFTNRLLQAYGPPSLAQRIEAVYQDHKLLKRDEQQSYLTVPEWMLVYLSKEQAALYSANTPREFGYFGGLIDYWSSYISLTRAAKRRHASMNMGYHFMLTTIGVVTSGEYALKGLYEQTLGRLFGLFGDDELCASERSIGETYQQYAAFIHHTPWFAFPFKERLSALWAEPASGARCLERKLSFSVELIAKRLLSAVFSVGVDTIYGPEDLMIAATIKGDAELIKRLSPKAELVSALGEQVNVWRVPRYAEFTELVRALKDQADLVEVAGNRWMVMSSHVAQGCAIDEASVIARTDIQGEEHKERVVQLLPVGLLTHTLRVHPCQVLEHVYDY